MPFTRCPGSLELSCCRALKLLKRSKTAFRNQLDLDAVRSALLGKSRRILVAVSGGADSVAMLRALLEVRAELDLEIQVVHFNHRLRSASNDDSDFVLGLCDRHSVPCHIGVLQNIEKPKGTSPEAYWRSERYRYFAETYDRIGAGALFLGHTIDDLAETFLYHVARGTGAGGVAFSPVKAVSAMNVVRPMWKTSRGSIEAALKANGQVWREDESNRNTDLSRNLIRQQVMPALRQINPNVAEAIARFCSVIVTAESPDSGVTDGPDHLIVEQLRQLDEASRVEALRRFIKQAAGIIPTHRQTQQCSSMISKSKTGLVSLTNSKTLVIDQNNVWIYPGNEPLDIDLARDFMSRHNVILAEISQPIPVTAAGTGIVSLTGEPFESAGITCPAVGEEMFFCNRADGLRIGKRTLKKYFIDTKVPWYVRAYLILVVDKSHNVRQIVGWPDARQ